MNFSSQLSQTFVLALLVQLLKAAVSSLITSNQTAYSNGRFISQWGYLISDIFQVSNSLWSEGL